MCVCVYIYIYIYKTWWIFAKCTPLYNQYLSEEMKYYQPSVSPLYSSYMPPPGSSPTSRVMVSWLLNGNISIILNGAAIVCDCIIFNLINLHPYPPSFNWTWKILLKKTHMRWFGHIFLSTSLLSENRWILRGGISKSHVVKNLESWFIQASVFSEASSGSWCVAMIENHFINLWIARD